MTFKIMLKIKIETVQNISPFFFSGFKTTSSENFVIMAAIVP